MPVACGPPRSPRRAGAPAHTASRSAPARRAASTCGATSRARRWIVWSETTSTSSTSNARAQRRPPLLAVAAVVGDHRHLRPRVGDVVGEPARQHLVGGREPEQRRPALRVDQVLAALEADEDGELRGVGDPGDRGHAGAVGEQHRGLVANGPAGVGERVRGRAGMVEHDQLQRAVAAVERTPPRSLMSSTASRAPRSIERAIQGSVETGALTTTGTASPLAAVRPPQAGEQRERRTAITPNRTMSVMISHLRPSGIARGRRVRRRLRRRRGAARVFAGDQRRAEAPSAGGAWRCPPARTSTSPRDRSARPSASTRSSTGRRTSSWPSATSPRTRSRRRLQVAAQGRRGADRGRGARRGQRELISVQVTALCDGKLRLRYTVS